jgi:hypothetical protein
MTSGSGMLQRLTTQPRNTLAEALTRLLCCFNRSSNVRGQGDGFLGVAGFWFWLGAAAWAAAPVGVFGHWLIKHSKIIVVGQLVITQLVHQLDSTLKAQTIVFTLASLQHLKRTGIVYAIQFGNIEQCKFARKKADIPEGIAGNLVTV